MNKPSLNKTNIKQQIKENQTMSAEKFWYVWLKVTMLIVIVTGILLVLIGSFIPIEILDRNIDNVFFKGVHPEEQVNMLRNWLFSVSGAIMAAWGSSMWYLVSHTFRQHEKWAWDCIFYPVVIWYLLDTSVSFYYGVFFNVIINSILLLQIMAPLLFLRNQFYNKLVTAT
jgi:hypothetical protein